MLGSTACMRMGKGLNLSFKRMNPSTNNTLFMYMNRVLVYNAFSLILNVYKVIKEFFKLIVKRNSVHISLTWF